MENIEELPKREVAKKVIKAKRLWFVGDPHYVSVEAETHDEAVKAAEKLTNSKESDNG